MGIIWNYIDFKAGSNSKGLETLLRKYVFQLHFESSETLNQVKKTPRNSLLFLNSLALVSSFSLYSSVPSQCPFLVLWFLFTFMPPIWAFVPWALKTLLLISACSTQSLFTCHSHDYVLTPKPASWASDFILGCFILATNSPGPFCLNVPHKPNIRGFGSVTL